MSEQRIFASEANCQRAAYQLAGADSASARSEFVF